MPRILFLDLATQIGYAAGSETGVEAWGSLVLPRTYENVGRYLNECDWRLEKLYDRFQPAKIAFASPFINRRRDTILGLRKLAGLSNVAEQVADRHEIECQEATEDDICRHFLGRDYPRKREPKKIAVKVKCRELGFDVANDDESDALAGLSFMIALECPDTALQLVPLFAPKEVTNAV